MLKIYNSLTRKIEIFKPIQPGNVGMYTCGPTVYQFAHIGNFRSYFTADVLVRALKYNGFDVDFVMNITDVGHMTQDQSGGADTGEDKIERTARLEGKTVWEVAGFYTEVFLKDYAALNLTNPSTLALATDNIKEQISLIKRIEKNGFTYKTSDGLYFDTTKIKDYGLLSDLDQIQEGASMHVNTQKKNSRDFALWKFSNSPLKRQMEWDSPWGVGFPGWHIECSAMSMKYLGDTFDIHTGGIDHKQIHHPNEIAQSAAATGKPLSNYWVHTSFMQVSGEKMSKSLGNTYTLYDMGKGGYSAMDLRYLYLQTHYRKDLNFTYSALEASSNAYRNLVEHLSLLGEVDGYDKEAEEKFLDAINDDLNTPKALAVVWELIKSDKPASSKASSIYKMDKILGLGLFEAVESYKSNSGIVPEHIKQMVAERDKLRREHRFNLADQMRSKIEKMGYEIEDADKRTKVKKKI